jgi:surfactin synthase thioesterase subunit
MTAGPAALQPWLRAFKPDPAARIRLFCLPSAGAGAQAYQPWKAQLPPWIQLAPIALPGRESRFRERPRTQVATLVAEMIGGLAPALDVPFALFGHSMGALLAFETARSLRREGLRMPEALLLSGYGGPRGAPPVPRLYDLPPAAFHAALVEHNGTPAEVLADPELLAVLDPVLRADMQLCETYDYVPELPLGIPITAFGGDVDPQVTRDDLVRWGEETSAPFTVTQLPGDHFYLVPQMAPLLQRVTESLSLLLASHLP